MIYEKVCAYCGAGFKTDRKAQKFCCKSCSNRRYDSHEMGCFDSSLVWERLASDKTRWQCPYETYVACTFRRCDNCGWNPEVAKARLEAYMNKEVTA